MVGIDKTKEVLSTLASLISDCIILSKGGINLMNIGRIMAIFTQIKEIMSEYKNLFEELRDLDAAESVEIAELILSLVQNLIGAVISGDE